MKYNVNNNDKSIKNLIKKPKKLKNNKFKKKNKFPKKKIKNKKTL